MNYLTEQENFWAGSFGDDYISRNESGALLYSKVAMWSQMLKSANRVTSIKELGCNIGLNLKALHHLNPSYDLSGVEINEIAAHQAKELGIGSITAERSRSHWRTIKSTSRSRRGTDPHQPRTPPRRLPEPCLSVLALRAGRRVLQPDPDRGELPGTQRASVQKRLRGRVNRRVRSQPGRLWFLVPSR